MTQNELLDAAEMKVRDLLVRLPRAVEGLSDDQLSLPAPGGPWSLGGIVDHMNVSVRPYLELVKPRLTDAGRSGSDVVRNTIWGRLITKGAGPDGNAPAPTVTHPTGERFSRAVVEEWIALHQEFLETVAKARRADLSQKYNNPIVPILKMNIVDFYTIMPAHGERHVGQIEARRAGVEALRVG